MNPDIYNIMCRFCLLPALSLAFLAAQAEESAGLEICILHTNDTHSHVAGLADNGNAAFSEENSRGGYGRIATVIKQSKAQNDNVIALDAGDQCQGSLFFIVNKNRMISDINQEMPYDAAVLGNHEFDNGCASAAEFTRQSPYPILAANLKPTGTCAMGNSKTQPYIIREIRGQKVGIIGLSNDEVVANASACKHTKFTDAAETVTQVVGELEKQGVQHIILITHLGLDVDRELARKVKGVDVIVGGHSHDYLGEGSESGPYPIVETSPAGEPVLVVTAKSKAEYLGELKVTFNEAGVASSWSGAARELTRDIEPDAAVSAKIKKYAKTLAEYQNLVITVNKNDMIDGMDATREGETLTALVVADAALDYGKAYGAQIAIINSGCIRAALPKGKVTRGDCMNILPFGGYFPVLEVTGAQILEALEIGASGPRGQGAALLQTAGMSYTIDPSKPVGARISEVKVAGEPLDAARTYRVTMPNYVAGGGDGFSLMTNCKHIKTPMKTDAKVLEDYLSRFNPLPMPETGRLRYKESP